MFYVKDEKGNKIEITDENIFNECPNCGKETAVESDILFGKEIDLFSTVVFCSECSAILPKVDDEVKSKVWSLGYKLYKAVDGSIRISGQDVDLGIELFKTLSEID